MACENSKCVCKENTPQVNWEQIIEDLGNMPSNKLCTGTKSSYTTDNWRALEMDKWLLAQTDVLGSQPLPADLGDGEGLPGLWAKYNAKMEKDDLFFWPSTCKQIGDTCALDDDDFMNKCKDDPQRSIVIWTLANFARYLQLLSNSLTQNTLITGLQLATMSNTFVTQESSDTMSDSAVFALMGGLLTSLASTMPDGFSNVFNFGAGVYTMLSAIFGSSSTEDPRFTSFADVSENFGRAIEATRSRIAGFYDEMLTKIPGHGALDDRLQKLQRMLASGDFANSDITLDRNVFNQANQIQAIQGGIINMMWRAQKLFVLKIPRGRLTGLKDLRWEQQEFSYDPCFGLEAGEQNDHLKNVLYCDGVDNYLILGWGNDFYTSYAQNDDDLGKYSWDKETVVKTSIDAQKQMNGFQPLSTDAMGQYIENLGNGGNRPGSMKDLFRFNLPVCDLGEVELQYDMDTCFPWGTEHTPRLLHWATCLATLAVDSCLRYRVDDQSWPYEI